MTGPKRRGRATYDPDTVSAGRRAARALPPLTADVAARVSALLSLPKPPTAGVQEHEAVGDVPAAAHPPVAAAGTAQVAS